MTLDLDKLVQTRKGEPVRILAIDTKGDYKLTGLRDRGHDEVTECWTLDGRYRCDTSDPSELDLVNVPAEPRVRIAYINVFGTASASIHRTRAEADSAPIVRCHNRIACVKISYEEGQFDE